MPRATSESCGRLHALQDMIIEERMSTAFSCSWAERERTRGYPFATAVVPVDGADGLATMSLTASIMMRGRAAYDLAENPPVPPPAAASRIVDRSCVSLRLQTSVSGAVASPAPPSNFARTAELRSCRARQGSPNNASKGSPFRSREDLKTPFLTRNFSNLS
ncbi:hypothetical protein DENSPDRAFT_579544 [Dentipellis sp. KUC8613]|nr:hypothetical protein DENSPDRAFT_579544 [Dentipellis sp. KUC8613]